LMSLQQYVRQIKPRDESYVNHVDRIQDLLLNEVSFSNKNFPSDVGNNKAFSGSGERTTYAPVNKSTYKYKNGFEINKKISLYSKTGNIVKSLEVNDRVYFTIPATLHKSDEFGIRGRKTTLAPVSLKGFDKNVDGYISISAVNKPSGGEQNRVGAGSKTQDMVADYIKELCKKEGLPFDDKYSTAKAGSTIPDLVMKIDNKRVQFEIKGTGNRKSQINFFDKSVSRAGRKPELIEEIANVYIDTLKIKNNTVKSLMKSGNFPNTFIGIIDFYHSIDSKIGLAGDTGVIKSGKLPSDFITNDASVMDKMYKIILDHFEGGGDDYFVIHSRSDDSFEVYFLGRGDNILNSSALPKFKRFELSTYGGASSGSTRVGLKIRL
jgi:hypothetical protein